MENLEVIRQQLNSIYHRSPSLISPPELEIGDFVISQVLKNKFVVKGYVWENDGWAYLLKHEGILKKHLIHQLIVLGVKAFNLKNKHGLGDMVDCKDKGFQAHICGLLFDVWWRYAVVDGSGDIIWVREVEECKNKF
jgi:hypothetical protein